MARIPFKSWAPDLPGVAGTNTMAVATNVYPYNEGYRPIQDLAEISGALDGKVWGAFCCRVSDGNDGIIVAGTSDKLYTAPSNNSSVTFTDRSSGTYHADNISPWFFTQFRDTCIAINQSDGAGTDSPQAINLTSLGAGFSAISAMPKCRLVATIRDFVVCSPLSNYRTVQWSAFADYTSWTAGVNQSDSQILPDGGDILAIIGGEFGLIFQESAITRMTYVGPPLIFRFDKIADGVGLASWRSLIKFENKFFFRSRKGFYVTDGISAPIPVGYNKVDSFFRTNFSLSIEDQSVYAVDTVNKLIYVAAPPIVAPPDGTDYMNSALIFNYVTGEWGSVSGSKEFTTIFAAYNANSANSDAFLAAFDNNFKLCKFTGSTLQAVLTTSDFEPNPGDRACVTSMSPLTDTSSATGLLQFKERPASSFTNGSSTTMQANGEIPVLQSGAFFRAQITIPAATSWTYINGIDYDAQPDGEL